MLNKKGVPLKLNKYTSGFTLIEFLIVITVIAVLIAIALPGFRGMQNEAKRAKAQGDVRVLKLAIETYYKDNDNQYPAEANYQTTLRDSYPFILNTNLYDPFGATSNTQYIYNLGVGSSGPGDARYYIVYSVGALGNGAASVDNSTGTITASNDAIWDSNGQPVI